jgi:hypothetical protein
MISKQRNIIGLLLVLAITLSAVAPSTANACQTHSKKANIVLTGYGGEFNVPLIKPFPTNYPGTIQYMQIIFTHVETANGFPKCQMPCHNARCQSFDQLIVLFYMQTIKTDGTLNPPSLQPFAAITTNKQDLTLEKAVWSGTLAEFNATLYGLPASFSTDNIQLVSSDALKIERHGTSVNVVLNEPIQLKRPNSPATYFTLPAFSATLERDSRPVCKTETEEFTGYVGSSNYTLVVNQMRFNATTSFSSTGLTTGATFDSYIAMHKTATYYPPN